MFDNHFFRCASLSALFTAPCWSPTCPSLCKPIEELLQFPTCFCSVSSICLPGVTTIQGNLRRKPNAFNLLHQLEMMQRGGHALDTSVAEMEAAHVSYHDVTLCRFFYAICMSKYVHMTGSGVCFLFRSSLFPWKVGERSCCQPCQACQPWGP